uniref:Uncharacterized protein n=1 Tax=Arundo donax TaxID=35708 RepID=A0A0A9BZT9_ARUDO
MISSFCCRIKVRMCAGNNLASRNPVLFKQDDCSN